MNNYVIAYLDDSNNYQIKFTSAEDVISALRRTIPKFVTVLEHVTAQGYEMSYENLYSCVSMINVQTFSIIEIPQLSTESNIRMQIISVYNSVDNSILLLHMKKASQIDALYSVITDHYQVPVDEYLNFYYENKDIRGMIMYFANHTGLRVYTVSTLRQLVKESIKR